MVKSEFVNALCERQPYLLARDIELAVNCMLEQMALSLEAGERIEIRGFGSFSLHHRTSRHARNPKTGELVHLPAKVAIHFKPGKDMKNRVNGKLA
ncbi:integration host factor subunit beta [Crenothrix polyspora]|uniref:Integration host factor (IHF), DNA-binding protein, beta subunit n=1 Tax=Crenothrix polyspora TaxID=360316 RepID=A0A1R4H466_9GAMM|nr:integration host factor subunit beta [Crenothrix polyspora]SJM90821.1 integration host factor (IHF), DNA-binding protein, beta subunit [Crenothrix polyspora]